MRSNGYLQPMISYAQNYEDVTLRRALDDIDHGFWIDVGANHPVSDSVTKWFSDQGWTGINIEPHPHFHALLSAARPADINLAVAVGAETGDVTLHLVGDSGLSTIKTEVADSLAAMGRPPATGQVSVRLDTLSNIIETHAAGRTVDFLKIDAEGAEPDIIAGANLTVHRPRIILVEDGEGYEEPLLASGYLFAWFDGLNRFYVRKEDGHRMADIAQPPSTWDNFTPAAQAKAEQELARVKEELVVFKRSRRNRWGQRAADFANLITGRR